MDHNIHITVISAKFFVTYRALRDFPKFQMVSNQIETIISKLTLLCMYINKRMHSDTFLL